MRWRRWSPSARRAVFSPAAFRCMQGAASRCGARGEAADARAAFDGAAAHIATRLRRYRRRVSEHARDAGGRAKPELGRQFILRNDEGPEAEQQHASEMEALHATVIAEADTTIETLSVRDAVDADGPRRPARADVPQPEKQPFERGVPPLRRAYRLDRPVAGRSGGRGALMAELVLYTNPRSRGRVRALDAGGVGGSRIAGRSGGVWAGAAGAGISGAEPDGQAAGADGTVDAVVSETAAICAYLATAFPEAGLAPAPGTPGECGLLPLAVFRRRAGGSGRNEQRHAAWLCRRRRKPWRATATLRRLMDGLEAAVEQNALHCRRQVQRRRCLCRRADRLRAWPSTRSRSGRPSQLTGAGWSSGRRSFGRRRLDDALMPAKADA